MCFQQSASIYYQVEYQSWIAISSFSSSPSSPQRSHHFRFVFGKELCWKPPEVLGRVVDHGGRPRGVHSRPRSRGGGGRLAPERGRRRRQRRQQARDSGGRGSVLRLVAAVRPPRQVLRNPRLAAMNVWGIELQKSCNESDMSDQVSGMAEMFHVGTIGHKLALIQY